MQSTSQVLQAARALVALGWTQGPYLRRQPHGPDCYCAVGAVAQASGADMAACAFPEFHRGAFAALNAAARQLAGQHSALEYNETPGRTQADVLRLFDVALELASK